MTTNRASGRGPSRARTASRRLAMQALYQSLLNVQPWEELHRQYLAAEEMARADPDYFRELIEQADGQRAELDALIAQCTDRKVELLDPIEHAILRIGAYELRSRPDVPFRVAISEAVELARKFGAVDGYKYVNAVLDCLAAKLRGAERDAAAGSL